MDVGLDETWKNDEPCAIEECGFLSNLPTVQLSNALDAPVLHQHIRIHNAAGVVHSDQPPAAEQQRFGQVEIRGLASALSEGGRSK